MLIPLKEEIVSLQRNENRLLVFKGWLFVDSELELGVASIANGRDTGN